MVSSAQSPLVGGRVYHLDLEKGSLPRYVLLPGDPGRVLEIARMWDEYEELAFHREYRSARGRYRGVPVAAVSTGIGGPSASIAVEELLRIGSDTFIRVGTCGALQEYVEPGDIIIAYAAVRFDGASDDYVWPAYPAVASPEIVMALIEAAERLGVRYHVGIVASTATFYLGQSRPGYDNYMWSGVEKRLEELRRARVLCFEMEAATIFTVAQVYGARAGCVCAAIANRVRDVFVPGAGVKEAIMVANEAVRILGEADKTGRRITPTLIARVVEHGDTGASAT